MGILDAELNRRKVAVRTLPGDEFLDLTFSYGGTGSSVGIRPRLFNFHRAKNETLGRTLERISQNLTARIAVRSKKKFKASSPPASPEAAIAPTSIPLTSPVQLALQVNESVVSPEIPNAFAWVNGAVLEVDQVPHHVVLNPPTITGGKITSHILPDFPIDCSIDYEFAEENEAVFVWLKHVVGSRSPVEQLNAQVVSAAADLPISLSLIEECVKQRMKPLGVWRIVSLQRDWVPTADDIGANVGLLCFPIRDGQVGEPFTTVAKNLVMSGIPSPVPYRRRHAFCQTRCDKNSFRVVSYNLLADVYAAMESSLKELFPYVPAEFMKIDYRRQLMKQELVGYNADLMCLQEVDTKHFEHHFLRYFRRHGYDGAVQRKKGAVAEGVATFYRKDKFRLVSQHDITITDAMFENPVFAEMAAAVSGKAKLKESIMERGTPAQVTVLEDLQDPSRVLVLANTHLWYRPTFPHVRLLQMAVILGHIEGVVKLTKKSLNLARDPAVLICGDFNSTSARGVHDLLRTGSISANFKEWKEFCEKEDEYVELSLQHPFRLFSACGEPAFTNFVPQFQAAIDWIYADESALESTSVIPLPTLEEVSANVAIPSVVFPSDHLAIGCDLKWKS
ncbi:2',5'-phosphodiesterase 12 [Hypsibius exemplaris]|uniref:2',5'-phosphodiesterase 12 n=1 Tax=Hypsibius exemplaris TaxID=2072580 RepID=A0A9X6RL54_HYPEX|nr:2',5'-phosphodiesterase 12 [Hypsibius exemplaris]